MRISEYKQFIKYATTGIITNLMEIGGLMLMKEGFGIHYLISNTVVSIIVLALSYLLNNYWTFRNKRASFRSILGLLLLNFINIGAAAVLLWLFYSVLGIRLLYSKILTNSISILWNFFIAKKMIYRQESI